MNSTLLGLRLNGIYNKSPFITKGLTRKFSKFMMSNVEVRNSFSTFLYFNKITNKISQSSFTNFHSSALIFSSADYVGSYYESVSNSFNADTTLTLCTFLSCASSENTYGAIHSQYIITVISSTFTNCGNPTTATTTDVTPTTLRGGGIYAENSLSLTNVTFTNCRAVDGAAFYMGTDTGAATAGTFTSDGVSIISCTGTNSLCHVNSPQTTPCSFISFLVQSSTLLGTTNLAILAVTSNGGIRLEHSVFEMTQYQTCLSYTDTVATNTMTLYNVNFTIPTTAPTTYPSLVTSTVVTNYNFTYVQVYSPIALDGTLFNTGTAGSVYGNNIVLNNTVTPAATFTLFPANSTISNTDTAKDPFTIYSSFTDDQFTKPTGSSLVPFILFPGWDASTSTVTPGLPVDSTTSSTTTATTSDSGSATGSTTTATTGTTTATTTDTNSTSSTTTASGNNALTNSAAPSSSSNLSTLEIVLIVIVVVVVVFGLFAAIFICVRMHQGNSINERTDPTQRPPVFP